MSLTELTKVTGPGIHTLSNVLSHNIKSSGIITATKFVGPVEGAITATDATFSGNVSIAGTLTYEDVTNIDSVGIITAPAVDVDDFVSVGSNIHLGNAGVITATSFVGSGAALTGIDATAIKDSGGNVKVQAQASGAMYTGIHTFSSGAEVGSNIKLGNAGVITATSFVGDGSDLTNLPAGLGTALSATASNPLNKMYYTNQVLGVPSSVTVDVPASASKAYTQYADIKVDGSADLIIAEGDDLIPDVLGLADFGTFGGGASAGRIRVNSISNAANDGSPTVQKGLVVTGVTTSTTFSGSGASLTNLPAANITGTLPAISGANLTNLDASDLASGTVPTARLGSGTASSSTFLAGDSTYKTVTGTTINNNADNRIITGSGTANTLEGESKLTFNGNQLLKVSTDSSSYGTLNLDGNAGGLLQFEDNGTLIWEMYTNTTELSIYDRVTGAYNTKFKAGGNVEIENGDLKLASGHGINFSATADAPFGNTSNRQELLDDYEEGQWAPVYSATTSGGSVSYSYRKGYYIKIGAQVTVWIEMSISSASGMSGDAQISNLPFNKNDLGGNGTNGSGTYYYSGTTNWYIQNHSSGKPIFTGWMPNNTNTIRIYNANDWSSVTNAPINTTGRMSFSYTYTSSA